MTLKKSFPILSSVILSLALCTCGTSEDSNSDGGDDVDGGIDVCQRDDSQKGSTATEWQLVPDGEPASGYICPKRDVDHYWFEVTQPRSIVDVSLSNNVLASTVQLCFDIYKQGEDIRYGGECDNDSTDGKTNLNSTWYLEEAGTYFIEVRDDRGDTEDSRVLNNYLLSIGVVQDKDEYEPNDSAAQAKTIAGGQGYLSYREDEDWYKVDVSSAGQIMLLELTNSAKTEVDLRYEVFMPDGSTRINAGEDTDGMNGDNTYLHDSLALAEAGTYYIKISDINGDDADLDLGYSLSVSTRNNPDARDSSGTGNEEWAQATPITSGSTITGAYLATRGDDDWYVIESPGVDDVHPALLEIDLVFPNASPIEPVINLLVADPHTPCTAGDACGELVSTCSGCNNDIECLKAQCPSHECLTHLSKCKGSGECLNGGSYWGCGVTSLFMYGVEWSETGNAKHLHTVAPMYGQRYYFRVSDYQSKRFDADNAYTLTITVRQEKDTHEVPPNGLYLPYMTESQENASRNWNKQLATPINCTESGGEIVCGPIVGYLSYRGDQDWYVMSRNGGAVVPAEPESSPAEKSVTVDWDLQIDWSFNNGKSGMPVGILVDPGRQTPMGPEVTAGSGTWGVGAGECSYFCGEYHTPDSFYLWVFNDTFRKYDYEHPYSVTIRLVRDCPANCGYCDDDRCEYGCPTPTNPDPESNCP